ncbi:MAG: sodium/solute symporter [Chitinophagales bacterium]|nr:sodium/solute symporter [Chitinophagales bacterium]
MSFSTIDLIIFSGWIIFMMGFGIWISRSKQETTQDYFLASKALPWWAVGGSLIASNISAEQFIGMSGSGYVVGFAIATYELMAALTLLIVAKFFLPVFLKRGIYTMPQFLEDRFDGRVRTGLAIFWVLLFVFVNITSVLYLGGLALQTIMGIPLIYGVIGLALFASTFSIFGGLKAVVWTDVVQVVVLIFGGLLASVMVLNALGGSFLGGLQTLLTEAPEKFDMILDKANPEYMNLPGISVLIGGMWIANIYYWGNNQYIIQRTLAAKSLKEAQNGAAFAAFLKILLPLIVVIPGIAAFVLQADIGKPDEAYPWVLNNYVGVGFKGLAFAALIAAIGSSLSSMVNSASTIFTLDIYRPFFLSTNSKKSLDAHEHDSASLSMEEESKLVKIGRVAAGVSLLLGVIVAPLLGNLDQAFQYIQEYTGFISPGVVAVFLLGLFWKKTSANAALVAVILAIPLSVGFKLLTPQIPFLDRMGLSFLILCGIMIAISLIENKSSNDAKGIVFPDGLFKTGSVFNISALIVCGMLAVIYALFW